MGCQAAQCEPRSLPPCQGLLLLLLPAWWITSLSCMAQDPLLPPALLPASALQSLAFSLPSARSCSSLPAPAAYSASLLLPTCRAKGSPGPNQPASHP